MKISERKRSPVTGSHDFRVLTLHNSLYIAFGSLKFLTYGILHVESRMFIFGRQISPHYVQSTPRHFEKSRRQPQFLKERNTTISSMANLSKIGPALGDGGRAHVFEATTTEGELIALKAVRAFSLCLCHHNDRYPKLNMPPVSCKGFL